MACMNSVAGVFLCATILVINPVFGANSIPLRNGLNPVEFDENGNRGTVVLAHRENGNAHSFEVATFYISIDGQLNIIPLFDDASESFDVKTYGGADCVIHDFRLIRGGYSGPSKVIVAERDLGQSFADRAKVVFKFYRLVHKEEVGSPLFAYVLERTQTAQSVYCDVGEAFRKELNIDSDSK